MERPKFKIVVPFHNAARWLPLCLDSVAHQTYRDFEVCVVDDASTDPQCREIVEEFCSREGWASINHIERTYVVPAMRHGVAALNPGDRDVVIQLDGDDWLYDDGVLEYLADVYRDPEVWMTFGRQVDYSTGRLRPDGKVWSRIRRRRHVRQLGPMYHLRSFRHKLWASIREESFRDAEGRFYRVGWDISAYSAMAEMAGKHVRYLHRTLYVYNDTNPISNFRIRQQEAVRNVIHTRSQKRYPKIGLPSR